MRQNAQMLINIIVPIIVVTTHNYVLLYFSLQIFPFNASLLHINGELHQKYKLMSSRIIAIRTTTEQEHLIFTPFLPILY